MATPHLNHYPQYRPFISPPKPLSIYNPKLSQLTINTEPRFKLSINFPPNDRFSLQTSASVEGFRVDGAGEGGEENIGFSKVLQRWVVFLRSVFPGGSWWKLCDSKEVETMETKVITVMVALRGMWGLLSNDKWVIFVAFGALIVAALSEISIPSLLAASIFSAQSGETLVFSRNSRLLLLLCFTSGICSGLRSGCFAIANMILYSWS